MKKVLQMLLAGLIVSACASTLPSKGSVQSNYSIRDAKTFSSTLDCESPKVAGVRESFTKDYCQILASNIKLAIQKELGDIAYDEKNPDLVIKATLEEINGGSAAARFWVGMGAGRSITTAYVKVVKKGATIAEQRITETTTVPNMATNNFANDDAILQDAPLLARKIGEFVKNPASSDK
jgi:hypothetical protein